jgi:hypothetical protein
LINILKKHEHKKIDLTREYYFKVVMRYIARNKATTSANKELMKSIHVNLGALMLEDNKNVGACLNGKEDAPIQAETKILLDSLRKVLSPGDVNYVLEFITKLTSKSYLNDYLSMVNRIEIVLDKSPIKTVLTTVTRKEQIDHAEYLKQLAEAELSVVNNKFTAAWVKSIFDGADIAGDATVLTGLNLNVVKKIAAIFIQSANPVKQVVDFQTLVTNASGLLQLHEYLTNFIEPVADIKPGSYEQVFAAAEFAMTPELQAYDPAAMVKLVKEFKTGKQHIADLVAQQSQASSQKINKNIDECVANALINSVYRALQLSASPKNLETNRRVLEKLHKLVDTHDSLTNVIHFVISVFDQFENNWARGSDLQRNSLDICLLQLLFNTGTPKGLFESTLAEIQAAYPAHRPSKGVQMSKFPLSDLQGDMVLWLAAPSAGNALRLNHQNCQIVREQTKLNLHSLHSMLQRFKMDATMNVGANSQAEVEEINIFSLIA